MTRLALLFAMIGLALATIALLNAEHKAANAGLPLVKSATAGDFAKRNMLYAPCPLTKRNLPQFTDDEEDHA